MPSNKVKRKIVSPWTEVDMKKAVMLANSTNSSVRSIAKEVYRLNSVHRTCVCVCMYVY